MSTEVSKNPYEELVGRELSVDETDSIATSLLAFYKLLAQIDNDQKTNEECYETPDNRSPNYPD